MTELKTRKVGTDRGVNGCYLFVVVLRLRSYQDGYWLVIVRTNGGFIVLPFKETHKVVKDTGGNGLLFVCFVLHSSNI